MSENRRLLMVLCAIPIGWGAGWAFVGIYYMAAALCREIRKEHNKFWGKKEVEGGYDGSLFTRLAKKTEEEG